MGHTQGFFLGGFAEGAAERKERNLKERGLEQQQSQFDVTTGLKETELENQQTKEIRNRINETRTNIQDLAKNTTDKNNKFVQQQLSQLTKTLATDIGTLNALSGGTTDQDFADAAQQSAINLFQSTPSIVEVQDVKRAGERKDITEGVTADPTAKDQFESVFDNEGNVIAQRNVSTGQIITDPRAPKEGVATFEPVFDNEGNVIAQRNIKTGEVKSDPRAPKDKELKPTQFEAAGFAIRMQDAETTLSELGEKFTGVTSALGGVVPSLLKSEDRKKFEQAERNFINAVLRRESGAAIAPSEFDSGRKQYIPQPNDGEEVLALKTRNRQVVTQQNIQEAGRAFGSIKANLPALTVNIGGQDISVGTIITNGRGQRGRVNQDGSITIVD